MIDIVTNNVRQIGTPADEGRVYISEKAYKRIKTEGFKDKETPARRSTTVITPSTARI